MENFFIFHLDPIDKFQSINEPNQIMSAFKNITNRIPSSPLQTIPINNKEFKKTNLFSSSSSSFSHQLLANQRISYRASFDAKKDSSSSRHAWNIKALTEEDRDFVQEDDDSGKKDEEKEEEKGTNNGREVKDDKERLLNAAIVLGAGSLAITRLLTIDHDYWHGWTLFEVLRYAPEHNWIAYEEALKSNPVLAKMFISGIVYSLGDWIAQCYEGKPLFEFDRKRMLRSGIVGFSLHGSLSHYYYQFCEALFPFKDWWVVPAKVAFDQTIWSAIWNSIYYACLGLLRRESLSNVANELKSTFLPMLTAGWKLWPFAHLITYGVVPIEQRLLWVDSVELIWVTILSRYSNEKSEARIYEDKY